MRLLALLLGLAAGTAHAHAKLRAGLAPDGAARDAASAELLLQFSEPVAPPSVRLETAAGSALEIVVEPSGDGSGLRRQPVVPQPHGSYLVRWRVVSVDGHPVAGRVAFAVGPASIPPTDAIGPGTLARAAVAWPLAANASRFLHLSTTLVGADTALALVLLPLGSAADRLSRCFACTALAAPLAAASARVAASALEAVEPPPSALLTATFRQASRSSPPAPAPTASAAGACPLRAALARRQAARAGTTAVSAGVLHTAAGFGFTGHAATAAPALLFAPLLVLHRWLAAFRLGALVPLAATLRCDPRPVAANALTRFSDLAVRAAAVLLLIGASLAARLLPNRSALWNSAWGRILLGKLALVAGLLAVAAVNRTRLLPRLAASDPAAGRTIRRLLGLDGALAHALLVATAALTTTAPPRLLAPADVDAAELRLTDGDLAARVPILPGVAGWNRLEVRVLDRPPPEEVRLRLQPAAPPGEPVEVIAALDGVGAFRTEPLLLVPAGTWRLGLGIVLDPFTRAELGAEIELR